LLSGSALQARGLAAAERLRAATGGRVFADRYAARMTRGRDIPAVERIPYFPEPAQALLAGCERLVLVEARPPVSFFGYPGLRSSLAPAGWPASGARGRRAVPRRVHRGQLYPAASRSPRPRSAGPWARSCLKEPSFPMRPFRRTSRYGRTWPPPRGTIISR